MQRIKPTLQKLTALPTRLPELLLQTFYFYRLKTSHLLSYVIFKCMNNSVVEHVKYTSDH